MTPVRRDVEDVTDDRTAHCTALRPRDHRRPVRRRLGRLDRLWDRRSRNPPGRARQLLVRLSLAYPSLEVTQLTQERTGCDDPKAYPDAPDVPAQDGDDLVAEELYRVQHDRQSRPQHLT